MELVKKKQNGYFHALTPIILDPSILTKYSGLYISDQYKIPL